MRVDWDYYPMNLNTKYYFTAQIANYARNASTFYVSLNWDFPDSVYDNGGAQWEDHPIAMQIFGLTER